MRIKLLLLLLFIGCTSFGQTNKKLKLYELKNKYIGKQAIIKSRLIDKNQQFKWTFGKKQGDYYVQKPEDEIKNQYNLEETSSEYARIAVFGYLPIKYVNQEAKIIALQLTSSKRDALEGKTNAFGETTIMDSIVDPYFDIIVKFKDGTIAMTSTYEDLLEENLELISDLNIRKNKIQKFADSILGNTLYPVKNSTLYKSTANVDDMISRNPNQIAETIPKLEPLIIVASKYITPQNILILKFKDSNNNIYLSYSKGKKQSYADALGYTFLDVIATDIGMYTKIPSFYTQDEIEAIKKGEIFKGMSLNALYDSIGFPDEKNENSYGGNQLIYNDWLYIYLDDENEKVDSWQTMH